MNRIRLAMIGSGFAAGLFATSAAALDEIEIAGVHAVDQDKLRAFAAEHGLRALSGLDDITNDRTIDAVYLATPNSTHYALALAMIEAGKSVLVEKPLAGSAEEAKKLVEAADAHGVLLMEAYRAAFEPNIAVLRDACSRLGQVRRAVLVMDQYSSRFDDYKAGRVHPAFDPASGGGSAMDIGYYPVALAVHLFCEPQTVAASAILLGNGADAQGTILLGYRGFEVACLHSKIATVGIESEVAGERSVITFDDCAAPRTVRLHTATSAATSAEASRRPREITDLSRPRTGHIFTGEIREFARLLRDGAAQSELHPLAHSVAIATILDEVRRLIGVGADPSNR